MTPSVCLRELWVALTLLPKKLIYYFSGHLVISKRHLQSSPIILLFWMRLILKNVFVGVS